MAFPAHAQRILDDAAKEHADQALTPAERQAAPAVFRALIEKVTKHAYKVTDEDLVALKAAACSEEEIFEVVISAAVGAARVRLEAGLKALQR